MKPLEILKAHNIELPFLLGEEIGSGVDGQIFEKKDNPSRVIKISCTDNTWEHSNYHRLAEILLYLDFKSYWHFAKMYDHGPLHTFDESTGSLRKVFTIHYIEMEKLLPLSEDEVKIFHTLLSHEDANKKKEFNTDQILSMVNKLSEYLVLDKVKVCGFCFAIMDCYLKHKDLHPRNIMKNAEGNFRLIDFDRLELV